MPLGVFYSLYRKGGAGETAWSAWKYCTTVCSSLVCSLSLFYTLWCISTAWGTAAQTLSPADLIAARPAAFQQGDLEHAAVIWREAARLAAGHQQFQAQSVALTHLAHAYEALGHYSQAAQSLHQALQLAEKRADHSHIATILGSLGNIALAQPGSGRAERLLRQALAMARRPAERWPDRSSAAQPGQPFHVPAETGRRFRGLSK